MGRFFTSTQIFYNKKNSKNFIEFFCKKMNEEGYTSCESDESEISYIFKFASNCEWVTMTSSDYEQGNQLSKSDTGRVAKMLETTCVNTVVIDSDCAVITMYDKNDQKTEKLIIGRADDYFGEEIPKPSKSIWSQLLSDEKTWEQFTEICNTDEVFVENSLSRLAEITGMDSENILFSAEEADDNDSNTAFLYFKKAKPSIVASQKNNADNSQKKISLNAAFKQIFGELLEPMGFKLVKSKYPYYLRVVGEGIIQAVSFTKQKSLNLYPNREEEEFQIYVGLDLLINPLINFDRNPTILDNQGCMTSLSDLYGSFIAHRSFSEEHASYTSCYQKGDTKEILNALKNNRDEWMPFVLDFFKKQKTIEDIYKLGDIASNLRHDVIVLLGKTDEIIEKYKVALPKKIAELEHEYANDNPDFLKMLKERKIKFTDEAIKRYDSFRKGTKEYNEFINTAEEIKEQNLKTLKILGVI